MLSHSYSDGQEILRIMNMMSIYSTVRLGLNIVRHYAEIGSANSPLVIFFFCTVTQYYRLDRIKMSLPLLVHKLAQVLLHHHTVENKMFYWSREMKPPILEKQTYK